MAWDAALWRYVGLGLWLAAGFAVWLQLINRWLIHWVDGVVKSGACVTSLLTLGALTGWAALRMRPLPLWLPATALVLLAGGAMRCAWLRHQSAGSPPVALDFGEPGPPPVVTTTAFQIRRYLVRTPGFGTKQLRVVHLSDLHVTRQLPLDYFHRVIERASSLEPDLLLLTGDFVSRRPDLSLLAEVLAPMGPPRLGAFAVLGNHDHWFDPEAVRLALLRAGVTLLSGRCQRVKWGSTALWLCGTEHPWGPGLELPRPTLGQPTLVLSHTPDNIVTLSEDKATAVFAGHTHGGQLRLPGLGALVVPSRYGRRFDQGHFRVGGTHLFVSTGVGTDFPPIRVFCPPEILVVDFASE